MRPFKKELIYLYCVTQIKPNRSNFEDVGVRIYPIYFQDTYAIVSKVSSDEFSEDNLKKNLANMDWVEKKVRQHEKIIEEIMKDATVLPFKFGTVFQSEENVENLLREHGAEYKRIIERIEGKEEWGVKIYCDVERLKGAIIKEEVEILKIEKEIESSSSGKAYFLKKKKEELIKDTVNKRINEYGRLCFEILKGQSLDVRINKLLPKEVTEREDDMILNSAFLVDKSRVAEFIQTTDALKAKYNDKGLNFDCTGPWPSYNFCQLSKENE
jgi:hypothetical protein